METHLMTGKLTDWQSTSLNFMVVQMINTMEAEGKKEHLVKERCYSTQIHKSLISQIVYLEYLYTYH